LLLQSIKAKRGTNNSPQVGIALIILYCAGKHTRLEIYCQRFIKAMALSEQLAHEKSSVTAIGSAFANASTDLVCNEIQRTAAKAEKAGRNMPCPCGSMKKFKKCCGAPGLTP
jgi:hypothetical protein